MTSSAQSASWSADGRATVEQGVRPLRFQWMATSGNRGVMLFSRTPSGLCVTIVEPGAYQS
jgi:hypothetical protein